MCCVCDYNKGGQALAQVARRSGGFLSTETFEADLDQALSSLI